MSIHANSSGDFLTPAELHARLALQEQEITSLRQQQLDSQKMLRTGADAALAIKPFIRDGEDHERVVIELYERREPNEPKLVSVAPNGKSYTMKRGVPLCVPPIVLNVLKDAVETKFDSDMNSREALRFPFMIHGPLSQYVAATEAAKRKVPLSVRQTMSRQALAHFGLNLDDAHDAA